jgi:hypothetical protein
MANKSKKTSFGVQQYLSNAGVSRRIVKFKKGQVIFSQDDPCDDVLYIQAGNAKLLTGMVTFRALGLSGVTSSCGLL